MDISKINALHENGKFECVIKKIDKKKIWALAVGISRCICAKMPLELSSGGALIDIFGLILLNGPRVGGVTLLMKNKLKTDIETKIFKRKNNG